jgi:AraC family transcriptional regulator, regulatory protein of adaptative response / DNA-3-methyladenine glycosylase II
MQAERLAWRRARESRDPRFDGRFFVGVATTGVYCRPTCPARLADERHVRYFRLAAEAAAAGFRPCLRCRPDTAPGTAAWAGTPATIQRALRLIDERVTEGLDVEGLADSLGIGPRHLHRLFAEHLGASPVALLQTRRLHFARALIDGTRLPFTTIAHASGYGSIRRFNAAVREAWRCPPRALRGRTASGNGGPTPYTFGLSYRPPFDWPALLGFLAARAIPGVESVRGDRYARALAIAGVPSLVSVAHDPAKRQLELTVQVEDPRQLYAITSRARTVFDLAADPVPIAAHLRRDPVLRPLVATRPGLRVPGAWDAFEVAVRAIVGQQVSVAAARTVLGRIAQRFGTPVEYDGVRRTFPGPAALAQAPLEEVGLTRARAHALRTLAGEVASGRLDLDRTADPARAREQLRALPGIGEWTTEYILLRGLGDPDASPAGDLVLRRATGLDTRALSERAEAWRPWRGYAAMHIWTGVSDGRVAVHEHRRESGRAVAPAGRRGRQPGGRALRRRERSGGQ